MLTACGIETSLRCINYCSKSIKVATVLTACGIETFIGNYMRHTWITLQQCLPLAVLKLMNDLIRVCNCCTVATVLTACGIETFISVYGVH